MTFNFLYSIQMQIITGMEMPSIIGRDSHFILENDPTLQEYASARFSEGAVTSIN